MANKKTPEKEKTEGEMVFALRCEPTLKANPVLSDKKMTDGRWSYRDFVEFLNEDIKQGMPGRTSFQSVWDWEHEVFPVTDKCLLAWLRFYHEDDQRHQLAKNILAQRMKSAHWVGNDEPSFEEDGKKLLKAVRVRS